MAIPTRKFARVNFPRFERLCEEMTALSGAEAVHEGEIIAERQPGDRRSTAFSGFSEGKSSRDCRNRMQFAMRKAAQERGREASPTRLVFIEETEFHALCAKPRIREELVRLELNQQPAPKPERSTSHEERQELLQLVADAAMIEQRVRECTAQQPLRAVREETPVEEEEEAVCACLSRVYVLVRKVGLLEGQPIVPQPGYRDIRAQVVAQMEQEARHPRRGRGRRKVWRVPKEQLGLLKD